MNRSSWTIAQLKAEAVTLRMSLDNMQNSGEYADPRRLSAIRAALVDNRTEQNRRAKA